jgi:MoxR-like ATPase
VSGPAPETDSTPLERIAELARAIGELRSQLHRRIIGQEEVMDLLFAAILAEGHCLLVGVPGLAKTLMVSSLAELLQLRFQRIQFTPDLMPSDITGTTVIRDDSTGKRDFSFMKGPLFANIVLADEINRTPPKTQAALLEAMEERQVSIAGGHLPLERPFFVLATQNPIEQEGTYPLPVSQLDRFLFSINIDYPLEPEEYRIVVQTTSAFRAELKPLLSPALLRDLLAAAQHIALQDSLVDYASRIVRATRPSAGSSLPLVNEYIAWGAGPRATQALLAAARAIALMAGRTQVVADDIHRVVLPTLRHRIVLTYHAQAEGVLVDDLLRRLLLALPNGLYREQPAAQPKKGLLARLFR